MITSS